MQDENVELNPLLDKDQETKIENKPSFKNVR